MFIIIVLLFSCLSAQAERSLITIKGGSFTPLYGSAKKKIKVKEIKIDQWPVTNQEYLNFVKENPSWKKSTVKKIFADSAYLQHWKNDLELGSRALPDGPVVSVSWFAAKAFCESEGKRLPTVNEWEYVASQPVAGVDIKELILNWYSRPTPDIMPSITSGIRNSSGVSSLHGLIWEWTLDFNSAMVTGESRADSSLDKTFYCGAGSEGAADKSDYAAFMRFAFRSSLKGNYTVSNLGFRCVKDVE